MKCGYLMYIIISCNEDNSTINSMVSLINKYEENANGHN